MVKYMKIEKHEGDILNLLEMSCKIEKIKGGGMGTVYICREMLTQMPIVFKTYQYREFLKEQFHWEAEVWVKLGHHENIVKAIGLGEIEDQLFIALEYVEPHESYGGTLGDWIRSGVLEGNISLVLDLAIQFCNGIIYARNRFNQEQKMPFIHRDIKPSNILVNKKSIAKITDFGLVRAFAGLQEAVLREAKMKSEIDTALTIRGSICGTPPYMAPEVWEGKEVDERTDIYSFGCALYEMLSGSTPFITKDFDGFKEAHLNHKPRPIKEIPNKLNEIVQKCLCKKMIDRFPFFDDLEEELAKVYYEETGKEYRKVNTGSELVSHDNTKHDYIMEGIRLGNLGKLEESIKCFDKAILVEQENPEIYYLRGKAYKDKGIYKLAIPDFKKAIELNPRYALAFLERGLLRKMLGFSHQAKDDLESFIEFASARNFPLAELVKNLLESFEKHEDMDDNRQNSSNDSEDVEVGTESIPQNALKLTDESSEEAKTKIKTKSSLNEEKATGNCHRVIGIDFGNTFSVVSAFNNESGKAEAFETTGNNQNPYFVFPSIVSLDQEGKILMGWEANKHLMDNYNRSNIELKRIIGKENKLLLGSHEYSPQMLLSMLFKELKNIAEAKIDQEINDAVIAIPVYFNNDQRKIIEDAASIPKLNPRLLIDEPAAVAAVRTAYGFDTLSDSKSFVIVYHLGGRTFYASIINIEESSYEIISFSGSEYLGGCSFDERLTEWVLKKIETDNPSYSNLYEHKDLWLRVMDATEKAKIELSNSDFAVINVPNLTSDISIHYEISKNEFIDLIQTPHPVSIDKTLELVEKTLDSAKDFRGITIASFRKVFKVFKRS
jgi:serine/threonine protein kinase